MHTATIHMLAQHFCSTVEGDTDPTSSASHVLVLRMLLIAEQSLFLTIPCPGANNAVALSPLARATRVQSLRWWLTRRKQNGISALGFERLL